MLGQTRTRGVRGVGASLKVLAQVVTGGETIANGLRVGEESEADKEQEEGINASELHAGGRCEGEFVAGREGWNWLF